MLVTIRMSPFATWNQLQAYERKKSQLENKGFTLIKETPLMLVYKKSTPTS